MKVLVICGLTASGKTSLALEIAKQVGNTCIISVDSRQAYQGLPILSGQDIPLGFTRHQDSSCKYGQFSGVYYSKDSINIWGVDQVPPTEVLNISTFTKFVWQVIKKESLAGKKIIIVGGSGLYLKTITQPMLDIHTGFDKKLRKTLSKLSVEELQKKLQNLNEEKYKIMNQSDRSNPRRLIRAIEILSYPNLKKPTYLKLQKNTVFRWVGLRSNLNTLEKKINKRVTERLNNKAVNEVNSLKRLKLNHKAPIYSALGLTSILEYIGKQVSKQELINVWTQADFKYAKRQITWFKKQSGIIWYDKDSKKDILIIKSLSSWL